jgi:hypothetical protein
MLFLTALLSCLLASTHSQRLCKSTQKKKKCKSDHIIPSKNSHCQEKKNEVQLKMLNNKKVGKEYEQMFLKKEKVNVPCTSIIREMCIKAT